MDFEAKREFALFDLPLKTCKIFHYPDHIHIFLSESDKSHLGQVRETFVFQNFFFPLVSHLNLELNPIIAKNLVYIFEEGQYTIKDRKRGPEVENKLLQLDEM